MTSLCVLILIGGFLAGWISRDQRLFLTRELTIVRNSIRDFRELGFLPTNTHLFALAPNGASRSAVTIHKPELMQPGYRAILAYDSDRHIFVLKLFNQLGRELHSWPIVGDRLGIERIADESDEPHGFHVFKNGDVAVNFNRGVAAIARLDSCGDKIWVTEGNYHHPFSIDDDGNPWSWRGDADPDDPNQQLVKIDGLTGEVLWEADLESDIYAQPGINYDVLTLPRAFTFPDFKRKGDKRKDYFHPNDAEPLRASLAPAFPMFSAGDLLVSFRNINLVAVLDPISLSFKWWQHFPWIRQHDADFGPDGKIYVFNNNTNRNRSDIVAVDPETRQIERFFSTGPVHFYSDIMGGHEIIDNNTLFVLSSSEGRSFELLKDGTIIAEYNNVFNEKANVRIMNIQFLPPNYFERDLRCKL